MEKTRIPIFPFPPNNKIPYRDVDPPFDPLIRSESVNTAEALSRRLTGQHVEIEQLGDQWREALQG